MMKGWRGREIIEMKKQQQREWGLYDAALWNTVAILTHVDAQRFDALPDLPVRFARQFDAERILAIGSFELGEWGAPGDGSYVHDASQVIAWGRGAVPLMLGHAVGRSVGNSRRRAAAAAAAAPRWMRTDAGEVSVSTRGFYLGSHKGHRPWTWDAIDECSIVGPAMLQMRGRSTQGPVSWQIYSHWAELMFNVWARVRNPDHPQLTTSTWISSSWARFAVEQGHALPVGAERILPASPTT